MVGIGHTANGFLRVATGNGEPTKIHGRGSMTESTGSGVSTGGTLRWEPGLVTGVGVRVICVPT